MNSSKVWYITGASQGLGLTLVKRLLNDGYRVAATSRNAQSLKDAVGVIDTDRFLPLAVDLNNLDCIDESIRQTITAFGRIDVLVNNAGYGMAGTVEEIMEQDIRNIFDVNVLATINVTRSVLPVMRKQKNGFIINMSSVAGFVGAPGWSIYSATKAAVTAFSEVLALDIKEFGIKVTAVEPSGFRTGFLTQNSLAFTESKIEGYQAVKDTQERYLAANGKQPGDPDKAAEILIQLSENQEPPIHLYLGQDAYKRASEKLAAMTDELEAWKATTIGADFQDQN
ncbi:short chain dehydrogenase [Mucilaginibacter lappiensis]|uniref:NAD(P)-dependent dehydrogenase (Short-subunit alcohol dehydrogenase family) n=1 Tax=Mucilaginibacter lappiensis TaxID=354630 RepID=A0ABR6PRG5_9SPHI|nr:SDR family NAD(P)-dependent oxidoreductase [Mucilaginibacter lappiensis]MBB6112168.1 NAD(P)-dependent dehydrogenase (short-subunit alcohol dehydrogenase family) [Mucilaginibacter lappiensis]SIR93358.1 short chain dehydrogenase [Mucilaginibacter lappiensis]